MDHSLASIQHLSSADQRLFIEYGFGNRSTPAFRCVHHAFEHHARSQPDEVAVEHLAETITYSHLDHCADNLARRLRAMGVVPGARVCLVAQRSIQMVIGILAVLKAGGAYVPLDGGIVTQSTLEHVIRDSECVLVLALDEYRHRVQGIPVLSLDDTASRHSEGASAGAKLEDLSSPSDSAYIIYTSGRFVSPSYHLVD